MSEDTAEPSPPVRPRRRIWPWAWGSALGLLALALIAAAGTAWWVWHAENGTRWALAHVPALQVDGLRGAPSGGPLQIQRLTWESAPGNRGTRVSVDGLAWRDAIWRWRPYPGAWIGLELVEPTAHRVDVRTAAPQPNEPPMQPPKSLRLPLELALRGLVIDSVQIDDQPPITALRADLHLGADRGVRHDLLHLTLRRDTLQLAAQGSISSDGGLPVAAQAELKTVAGAALPWNATVQVTGPLARLALDAALQTTPAQGSGARLTAQAGVAPFAAWPLQALRAQTQDLDLAGLGAGLPQTRLSGSAVVDSRGRDAPVDIQLDLANAAPGRWDEARLPLRRLNAALRGVPTTPDTIEFTALDAELGGAQPGGRLTGSGRWQGGRLALAARVDALRPAQLDARAAAMTLAGPITLTVTGLPSPDANAPKPAAPPPPLAGEVKAELTGRLAAPAQPVTVQAELAGEAPSDGRLSLDIRNLRLRSGNAAAALSGAVRRDVQQRWRVSTDGRLTDFDPAVWWQAALFGSRRTATLVNAGWKADVSLPAAALSQPPLQWLQALRGDASLTLQRSRLADVPLQGTAALHAADTGISLESHLDAAGNTLIAEGRTSATARGGANDRWRAELHAPAPAALAPLLRALPTLQPWLPQTGTVQLQAQAQGRWPQLATQGQLRIEGLVSPSLRVANATGEWRFAGLAANAPLGLTLNASGIAHGAQRLDHVQATLTGTPAAHRLQLDLQSPLRPPAWTDPLLGGPTTGGTRLTTDLSGGWRAGAGAGGEWRGTLAQLRAGPPGGGGTPWVAARDLQAQFRLDADGAPVQASLAPGAIDLIGSTLRWREARWQAGGGAPVIALDAELPSLPVVPLLAALQPGFGWAGDLALGARVQVRSGERFDADVSVQRTAGDLRLHAGGIQQAFGLSQLRLALAAHNGQWTVTQALAGSDLGTLTGTQTVRAPAAAMVPPADAPLQGSLDLRLPELTVWAPLLPAGWRVDGRLQAGATLGGTVGAPTYSGELNGNGLAVRNLLQGVQLKDGELRVRLTGEEARIDRLVFKGGDGTLAVQGGARFGAQPAAQLRLVAQRFLAIGRIDRRVVVSGDADIGFQPSKLALDGRFNVDEGLIDITQADAPKYDADVVVVNRPRRPGAGSSTEAPGPKEGKPQADRGGMETALNVAVDLGPNLKLHGRGLDTGLRGQLRVTSPGGALTLNGVVRTEGGTYTAYGQNLAIDRGVITFTGEPANPLLDIRAIRGDIDVRVGVIVTGNAVNPRVRLYSEPEMADMDRLAWLVLGRAPNGLGGADTAYLQRIAMALLAGDKGKSQGGMLQRIGLDELSVGQGDDGSGVKSAVVTVGKQLSKRLFVGYERGLSTATGSWQLIYRIAQRVTLRARTGAENAVDAIWTWRWD